MRTLGTLILLSAAAFAQTPTAVQNPAAPATVSVQPATTHPAPAAKPSPSGAKASGSSSTPKPKPAVSVKAAKGTNNASTANAKAASAQAPAGKPILVAPKGKAVSVQAAKPASADSKTKTVSAQASAVKPVANSSKAASATKSAPIVGVLVKPTAAPVAKASSQPNSVSVKANSAGPKSAVVHVITKPGTVKTVAVKPVARVKTAGHKKAVATVAAVPKAKPSVQESKPAENKPVSEEIRSAGWRDPFLSPVVAMGAAGSGCSAGKRCLTIDQIALKGVVKSESGMIAVVTNAVDKAYFLRENDPVFNGYVVKITGDSIIFKETFRDRLGKALTRDVTKSITRPVA